ncbi:MAG: zinc ribbon domain-containing protein [Actinobacteria bacterium]|nr:zinc ribbon domain-containing protein [Actinomycetota bacterium]
MMEMKTCPQCGNENRPESRFCARCGAVLEAQAPPPQPTAPAAAPPTAPPPAQPLPAAAPYPQATATPPATPPYSQAVAAPAAAARPPVAPPMARAAGKTRGAAFWIGAVIILVAGVLILISTFMSWGTGPRGYLSLSGWDWFDIGRSGGGTSGDIVNPFFVYSEGYPVFTGLCSLIAGGLLAFLGLLTLLARSKALGGVALLFAIFALGMAVTNLTTILRTEGITLGVGMYLFLVFSFMGLVGGGMSLSG